MVPPSLYLHFATHKTQLSTFRFAFKKKKSLGEDKREGWHISLGS